MSMIFNHNYAIHVMGRVTWCCHSVVLLFILCSCRATILESIHWNSSNTRFTPGQGLVLFPQIGDKMDIVCPRVGASSSGEKEEFYRVYLVTRSQMQRCIIDKTDAPLLSCDKPHRDVKFTFKFQEFSPNLWGLEFLKGRDYFITSTSTGTLQGLDNSNGGVCRTKSMKLVLRVGQSSSDPPSEPQESPTRFPPKQPKLRVKESPTRTHDGKSNNGEDASVPSDGTEPGLFIGIISGGILLILVIIVLLLLLWKCHQRRCAPDVQQSASMPLNTLAGPKRDSVTSDNNGSDRSDVVFPLRPSDSMFCRHYEPVNSDYGPPVYIVQEIPPQSPTNIYYKV